MNEIERLLRNDSSNKKKIGNSIKYRKSTRKGGGNRPLLTPSYFLSKKEKQELNGDVKVYNKDTILSREEFEKLSKEEQKESLTIWRSLFPTKTIKNKMGINNNIFYEYIKDLNIPLSNNRKHDAKVDLNDFDWIYKSLKKHLILSYNENPSISYTELMGKKPKEFKNLLIINYVEAYNGAVYLNNKYKKLGDNKAHASYFYNSISKLKRDGDYDELVKLNDRLCKKLAIDRKQKEIIKSTLDEIKEEENDVIENDTPIEENIDNIEDVEIENNDNLIVEDIKDDNISTDIKIETKGFNLTMDGYYTSEDIARRLLIVIDELKDNNGINKLSISLTGL